MAGVNERNITLEDVRLVFRNFAGKEGKYNREGDRNFSVRLDEELGDRLETAGWNVKRKEPREEGDDPLVHLPVAVSFKGRPPRVIMISYGGGNEPSRTKLDEETCELLDDADIRSVDMILRPYPWAVNGKSGIKAYLHAIYVTINEDELEIKYADVKDAKARRISTSEVDWEGELT